MSVGLLQYRNAVDETVELVRADTRVASLRKIYGEDFLSTFPAEARLSTVLDETDMSLTELVRQHRRGKK